MFLQSKEQMPYGLAGDGGLNSAGPATDHLEPIGNATSSLARSSHPRRILTLSTSFPSSIDPGYGVFVKERLRFVSQLPDTEVQVLAPAPYFPPIKCFPRWYPFSQLTRMEVVDGLTVRRPRYFLPPRIGGYFHSSLMYPAVRRAVRHMQPDFPFDVIDAHFAYPNGAAAVRIGRECRKPVVITCRGEDIVRFPHLPLIGRRIREALQQATQLIAVSHEIAELMQQQGADPAKITVIPNGVDCERFRLLPQKPCRSQLGLPLDRPLILAVGYRLELKGFHLLVDAVPKLIERFPNVLVTIVGGQARWAADYRPQIEQRIRAHNVGRHVLLAGARPQQELPLWYGAADVLSILSSREGSPNVLLEAHACGLPAVATPVGGIPEFVNDSRLGRLLPRRSAEAAADGLIAALSQPWDRPLIRRLTEHRSWNHTAEQIGKVFEKALSRP